MGERYFLVDDKPVQWTTLQTLGAGADGNELVAMALVVGLAAQAAHVIALGTCASFGG